MTTPIGILGAGKIGRMVCHMLSTSGLYQVRSGDVSKAAVDAIAARYKGVQAQQVDFSDQKSLDAFLKGLWGVVSCAPYHCNPLIAERAKAHGVHYFDLTEDVAATRAIQQLADGAPTAFMPQCGLAPGFIGIVAHHLAQGFDTLHEVKMRVGALPAFPTNSLKYNLTWSVDGLINEYCHPCEAIRGGRNIEVLPLEGLEHFSLDGTEYEAFNTSGGLGTLAISLLGKVRNVNYKTIRYPGHCDLMKLLLQDLGMRDHQAELARIFDRALPTTNQDQIVVFVSATGTVTCCALAFARVLK
jgi:saccharopine dehydrogenase-like NADP-dependent oxidoreductase